MHISSILFIIWRLIELFFLIPMVGMLSYLIHGYVQANTLTPDFLLVIFIVTVLAAVWVLGTTFFFGAAKRSGIFLALMDLAFFGALIGSVVALRGITAQGSCANFAADPLGRMQLQLAPFGNELEKACNLLKASFALAILEILMFPITFFFALFVRHAHRNEYADSRSVRHSSRHSQRRSRSRAGGSRAGSRAGSRPPSTRYTSRSRRDDSYYEDSRRYGGGSYV